MYGEVWICHATHHYNNLLPNLALTIIPMTTPLLRFSWCCLCLLVCWQTQARGYFEFHPSARSIYTQIVQLRLTEASTQLARMKSAEPNNLIAYHLEDYIDFFTLYISEDEEAYRRMSANRDRRLALVAQGDSESPYFLYVQAEIRLHWALLRLRFEEYLPAFTDINRAHKLLLRNQERFPDFLGNIKDLGILHAAVGTVPDEFRWALELLSSLEGTIEQGKREIEEVIRRAATENFPYELETRVLYSFLLLHLDGRPDAAWEALGEVELYPDQSPLHAFVLANVAMRTGHNDQAIEWLENRPRSRDFLRFPYLDYMLGVAKLRQLDPRGKIYLQSFIATTQGRHFIKEAYQKLAWASLLEGNTGGYNSYMQLVRERGRASAGGDKNALREAKAAQVPTLELLQARLLFDGGYYQRAHDLLTALSAEDFSHPLDQLEYHYRRGRILHGLKRYDEALRYYDRTIEDGRNNPAFYACNAALQAGLVEEIRQRNRSAKAYFDICLSLQPDAYKTGLHQQAKAGLSRLND